MFSFLGPWTNEWNSGAHKCWNKEPWWIKHGTWANLSAYHRRNWTPQETLHNKSQATKVLHTVLWLPWLAYLMRQPAAKEMVIARSSTPWLSLGFTNMSLLLSIQENLIFLQIRHLHRHMYHTPPIKIMSSRSTQIHSKLWTTFPRVEGRMREWVKEQKEWEVMTRKMVNLCENFTPQKTKKYSG